MALTTTSRYSKKSKKGLKETIGRLQVTNIQFVPVSALAGDNVVYPTENMPWYQGPTLLEYIQEWKLEVAGENLPRLGVQMISRAENFRGVAGTVFGGSFSVGDEVSVLPSGKSANVSRISTFDGELASAEGRAGNHHGLRTRCRRNKRRCY